jgi:hypothetical protein
MNNKEQEFELDYCPICIQATNHGCCKCAYKKGRASAIKEFEKFLDKKNINPTELQNWSIKDFYILSKKAFAEEFEKELGGKK